MPEASQARRARAAARRIHVRHAPPASRPSRLPRLEATRAEDSRTSPSSAARVGRPRTSSPRIALTAGLLALLVGFTTPVAHMIPSQGAYNQTGTFSYTSTLDRPEAAYPDGKVTTGQPVFLTAFKTLEVGFGYRFVSQLRHHVTGTIGLEAVLSSTTSSWNRTVRAREARAVPGRRRACHRHGRPARAPHPHPADRDRHRESRRRGYDWTLEPTVHVRGSGRRQADQQDLRADPAVHVLGRRPRAQRTGAGDGSGSQLRPADARRHERDRAPARARRQPARARAEHGLARQVHRRGQRAARPGPRARRARAARPVHEAPAQEARALVAREARRVPLRLRDRGRRLARVGGRLDGRADRAARLRRASRASRATSSGRSCTTR